ncbi:hypothetical protein [Priestia flexa]|uniref:hypothetical protein n=1 Tax=Priestia flexa TaxID=86664 RepID=UPI001C96876F|nr:hypothetical protein [Priestia flexa]MBY6088501.1 hypothetical protein [Priestia flexa]
MSNYHKIILNGQVYYRGFDETTGYYEDEMLTEKELVERLLEDAIGSIIEIDKEVIERVINCIPSSFQREMVQNYINYLEAVVESLE